MSDCRLILLDLDGTLLDSRKTISSRNLAALQKCRAKGIGIGVATARGEATAARFTAQIEPDVLIAYSGALVRRGGDIIYQCPFTREESAALVGAGVAAGRGMTVDCVHTTYANRVISFFNEPGMTYTDFADFDECAFKICIEGTDREFAEKTAALIEDCSWLAFSDCNWFKFSKSNVSKGSVIPHIEQAMGITKDEIVAFGDDYVDVEMLAQCGVGVAMGNAVDGVRQYADIVIGDNDSDAIADYIEDNLL